MKKSILARLLSVLLVLCFISAIASMLGVETFAFDKKYDYEVWDVSASGKVTATVQKTSGWYYKLTISGSGAMKNWSSHEDVPWYIYRFDIIEVVIEEGVTNIGSFAFKECYISTLIIPNSVRSIGAEGVSYCYELSTLTVGSGASEIHNTAFSGNIGLTSLGVSSSNSKYYSQGNCIIERSTKTLIAGCGNSDIPFDVKRIGPDAFSNQNRMTDISIPNGVEEIGVHAFRYCWALQSVSIPDSVTEIGDGAFSGCRELRSVSFGNNSKLQKISGTAFEDCESLLNLVLPNGLGNSGNDATKKIVIHESEFDHGVDYYIASSSSSTYNPILANMLAALSAAAYKEDEIKAVYASLGFTAPKITHDYGGNDANKCGSAVGVKESAYNGDTICLITLRGTVGDFPTSPEWQGNFDISIRESIEHNSFSLCADTVYTYIENLLRDRSAGITDDNVKYVITGHSRGGAVGNLLADELMKNGVNASNVYNYNFAPPYAVYTVVKKDYKNVYNLCNTDDLVPTILTTFGTNPINYRSWQNHGQTIRFTNNVPIIEVGKPIPGHDMEKGYLEFFDLQLAPSKFPLQLIPATLVSKILCPVDVIVTDGNGVKVASVIGDEVEYYGNTDGSIIIFTDGDKKAIYFADEEQTFNIDLIGTDTGTMTFSVEKCNLATGEVTESKTFSDVVLETGKTMYCLVDEATVIEDVSLFVVEEKDGELIYTHTIGTDGTETPIDDNSSNSSTEKENTNESKPTDTEGKNGKIDLYNLLDILLIGTIITVGILVVGITLLIIVCVIIKKKRNK